MWIMSTLGFYSIVKKEGGIHIRARKRGDIERLLNVCGFHTGILESREADYRYRIIIPEGDLGFVMEILGSSVEYPNFKDAIAGVASQQSRVGAYHRIWSEMEREAGEEGAYGGLFFNRGWSEPMEMEELFDSRFSRRSFDDDE